MKFSHVFVRYLRILSVSLRRTSQLKRILEQISSIVSDELDLFKHSDKRRSCYRLHSSMCFTIFNEFHHLS